MGELTSDCQTPEIAFETLREQATLADLAARYQVHANQIYGWEKLLQDYAGRTFDPKVGQDAEAAALREIDVLHAKSGLLTIENYFSPRGSEGERPGPASDARPAASAGE